MVSVVLCWASGVSRFYTALMGLISPCALRGVLFNIRSPLHAMLNSLLVC